MKRNRRASGAAGPLLVALLATAPASAQKAGGILKMYTVDSPASMSILEEATVFAERPMMGVFNNLVIYDQHVKQNSLQSIVPRSCDKLVVERRRDRVDIPIASRRDMARWEAVHSQGCGVHMGPADRQVK